MCKLSLPRQVVGCAKQEQEQQVSQIYLSYLAMQGIISLRLKAFRRHAKRGVGHGQGPRWWWLHGGVPDEDIKDRPASE